MTKHSAVVYLSLISLVAVSLVGSPAVAADVPGNLIANGGFEAGMQIWRGDGKIVLLPDSNRVCEIEASKSRMKDIKQEFHMKQLQQVEVVFRARSLKYTGPGIRVSIHQIGGGSMIWNRDLPADGSWGDIRIVYTRTTANNDLRELNIATLLGAGQVQIDDVEVREPSKVVESQPPQPNAPRPAATPVPETKPQSPIAAVKPPAPPAPPPLVVPPGTFGSLEQLVNSAPPESLRKLQDSATTEAGVTELNDYFAQNARKKHVLLRIKINKVDPIAETRNKFRIGASDTLVKWNGGSLNVRLFAYFLEANMPAEGKASLGSEVTVSAWIGRCDITTKGALRLNIDLQESKLESP